MLYITFDYPVYMFDLQILSTNKINTKKRLISHFQLSKQQKLPKHITVVIEH